MFVNNIEPEAGRANVVCPLGVKVVTVAIVRPEVTLGVKCLSRSGIAGYLRSRCEPSLCMCCRVVFKCENHALGLALVKVLRQGGTSSPV